MNDCPQPSDPRSAIEQAAKGGFVRNSDIGTVIFAAVGLNVRFSFRCAANSFGVRSQHLRASEQDQFRSGLDADICCALLE